MSGLKITCEVSKTGGQIRIDGTITGWDNMAAEFRKQVDTLISSGTDNVAVYINSGGGSVFEANEIVNVIKKIPGTTTAYLGSICASAATYIAVNCSKTIASANTSYMIHKPSMTSSGNASQLESDLKLLKNLEALYLEAYTKKTGISADELGKLWAEDFWMNAEEALAKKFVDEIDASATANWNSDLNEQLKRAGYRNLPPHITNQLNDKDKPMSELKQSIARVLAMNADANDNSFVAEISNIKAKAEKYDALDAKVKQLEADAVKAKVDAVITQALAKKQILANQEAYYRKNMLSNFDETKTFIESLPVPVDLAAVAASGKTVTTGEDRSKWTYSDYMEKDPSALRLLAEQDEEKFNELFAAWEKTGK